MNKNQEIKKENFEKNFQSLNISEKTRLMLAIAFNEKDLPWAQNLFIKLFDDENSDVKGLSLTCLGHLARIHKAIDKKIVIPFLEGLLDDKDYSGRAQDALDDINQFVE